MAFNYSKLRGRIKEKCGTQEEFAKLMGLSEASVSKKLNDITDFTDKEILRACEVLNININELGTYFFCTQSLL